MPTVFSQDMHKYVTKNDMRQYRRNTIKGSGIYLPTGHGMRKLNQTGDGIFDTLGSFFKPSNPFVSFMKDNKGAISDAISLAGKIAKPIMSTAVGLEQIKLLREQRKQLEEEKQKASQQATQPAMQPQTTGAAIYLPDSRQGGGFKMLNT
jgi:hypothetical protein